MTENQTVLPAGPALDALMAEKVMGWRRMRWMDYHAPSRGCSGEDRRVSFTYSWHDADGEMTENVEDMSDCDGDSPVWSPSTDIGAAWPVFEKLRMMLPGQEIMLYYCNGWSVGSLCQAGGTIEIGNLFSSVDSVATAPHAICLTALEAVEEIGRLP